MPSLTKALSPSGPIVQIAIVVSKPRRKAMQAAGQTIPSPVFVDVLVDTGASGTCIDPAHLAKLGIQPSGVISAHTPSTAGQAVQLNQYDVDIAIPLDNGSIHIIDTLPVVEAHLSCQGIDGLLGR